MSCPTRLGFRRLAEAHTILGDAYPAQDHPEIDAHLERIEPTIRFFQDLRAACARERHAEHEDHTRTKDALRPLLQELLQEELAKRLQASPAPQAQAAAKSVQLAQPENEVRAEG